MPRNMSFSLTTEQFLDGSKTVTRRRGWKFLKVGDIVCGVRKGMGLKKGEKVERLGLIEIVSTRGEPLMDITAEDCRREGFPNLTPWEFTLMLCKHSRGCTPGTRVNRIEFKHLTDARE